jgi:hypothetical protein
MEIHQETPLNIDLEINNKRQGYKIGTVCVRKYLWEGTEGEQRRLRQGNMVDGLHIFI